MLLDNTVNSTLLTGSHFALSTVTMHLESNTINKVALRLPRLVLGWVAAPGFSSRCPKFVSVRNHPSGQLSLANPPRCCCAVTTGHENGESCVEQKQ